jgi:hypothetical protein
MTNKEYERVKLSVRGLYKQFNTQVLKTHIRSIFNYDYLISSAKDFNSFAEYLHHHTNGKEELISETVDKMFAENVGRFAALTREKVGNCLISRLGNIYFGNFMEYKIITKLNSLNSWITCEKTSEDVDLKMKVDAIITLVGIGNTAIQIKPESYVKYDDGSELGAHAQFKIEYDMDVHYLFYKDDMETIILKGEYIRLDDIEALVKIIEKLTM